MKTLPSLARRARMGSRAFVRIEDGFTATCDNVVTRAAITVARRGSIDPRHRQPDLLESPSGAGAATVTAGTIGAAPRDGREMFDQYTVEAGTSPNVAIRESPGHRRAVRMVSH